jgi:FlaA1/EpsC-like NDP-sugar epimerase
LGEPIGARPPQRKRRLWTLARVAGGIKRYGAIAILDWLAVGTTYLVAVAVRTGGRPEIFDPELAPYAVMAAFGAGALQMLANVLFDVYWRDWSAAAIEDMVAVIKATILVVIALFALNLALDAHVIPTGAILAGGSLSIVVEAALHLRPRWPRIARAALGRGRPAQSLIVVGAGHLGRLFAADVADGARDYRIACFVDDDARKTGSYVRGVPVAGRVVDLPELVDRYASSNVVIAVANPPAGLIRRVIDLCETKDVRVRRVTGFSLLRGDTTPLQAIGIEELLSREAVDLTDRATAAHYADKRILITGAAGSIGSELARQLMRLSPERLLLLDTNESGLHGLYQSLGASTGAEIVLGDIRDQGWLRYTFGQLHPHVVFHAAAYKHVPILERTPLPGIATNVVGTANVLEVSSLLGVERFVFVSTDKAVEPTSVLGFTKKFGELLTLARARETKRDYAVVRFGNVLASAGSAVPIFTSQINNGGPVTVTHAEATRYLMTIEEAVGLLIVSGALAQSGDLLVLEMGAPVSIVELAKRMIRLRGLRIPTDIEIRYIGLRPGEKLHEQLFSADERAMGTSHPRIVRIEAAEQGPDVDALESAVRAIDNRVSQQDSDGALDIIAAVIGARRTNVETSASANWTN